MSAGAGVVYLFDVDNTLLDNDRIASDLLTHIGDEFGDASRARYEAIFEQLRTELGYADYLGALQRYRIENTHDPRILGLSSFLLDYPFAERLYPRALDVLARCAAWGPTVILSDGDVVFQPRKIERSGIEAAVGGRVLVYVHKERELADVAIRYPANRYVMVDDKVRILAAMKGQWGARLSTVFPRQGHYAHDAATLASYPQPDVTVEAIGDLLTLDRAAIERGA